MTPEDEIEEFKGQIEGLKMLAEDAIAAGEPPDKAGVSCSHCGIELEVPFVEIDSLVDGMIAHMERCPRKTL